MPETMLTALSNIRTVEEMIVAFRDEVHCRPLQNHGVARRSEPVRPVVTSVRSRLPAAIRTGKRLARPGLYQCSNGACRFQFTRRPYPSAFDQAALACLAESHVANAPVGQGLVLGPARRDPWREPTDGLAHGSRPAADDGAGKTCSTARSRSTISTSGEVPKAAG